MAHDTPPLWIPLAQEPGHPLAALEGAALLGTGHLTVRLGPANRARARYFSLSPVLDAAGKPVFTGLHHSGTFPAHNWIEVIASQLTPEQEEALWPLLNRVIPPGGHLMVEYESSQRTETRHGLAVNVPAVLTPLGFQLYRAGCGDAFKDWYISEGGLEGPRKLQGYRALNGLDAQEKRDRLRTEVAAFLESTDWSKADSLRAAARLRAEKFLGLVGR